MGLKVAAVADKPQTTRTRIRGIVTRPEGQMVLVDTPGIHKPVHALNERMMRAVRQALEDVDAVLLVVDACEEFGRGDAFALELVAAAKKPIYLFLNKIDALRDKSQLLPRMERYRSHPFRELVPGSALTGEGVELLLSRLFQGLPAGPALYPEDEVTDQTARVLAAEMVREKLLHATREEIPYATAVTTESFSEDERFTRIRCLIFVERESQKGIVIGRGGSRLKEIGTRAREDLEALLGRRVVLELFVKVRPRWREDAHWLDRLGLEP